MSLWLPSPYKTVEACIITGKCLGDFYGLLAVWDDIREASLPEADAADVGQSTVNSEARQRADPQFAILPWGKRARPPTGQVVSPAARMDEQSPKASGPGLGIRSWKETCTPIPASILNSP